ncbi:hypothetical protein Sden_3085 [Shewanella denitrificans OS217]|uniref:Uncharacterized protein n=1 Tax=Shewanella denitrificans (strain OS217 / ATCC BAA-1090 / DSM 15013) TaxID=318161 RepID=Q12JL3_SHEDO|nr:hypothetical protein Sden_3085 [Shewanella denitrificans OS217]
MVYSICRGELECVWRVVLISTLIVMASINVLLDFLRNASISDIHVNVAFSVLVAGFATGLPAAVAFLVSAKTSFKLWGINIYRLAADFVLTLGLLAWGYLVFIRDRPEFYEGASHMYIATWPVLLGVIAMGIYLFCLLTQGLHWVVKHNQRRSGNV